MQIQVREIEPCKLNIHYQADADEIVDKKTEIIKHFQKAPVPGFRPGKATIDAVKLYYRNQIEEALKRSLAEEAFHNTLFEKKLRPHGPPRFNNAILVDGKFHCEFDMFTKPDFELAQYKGLELPKPHEPYTDVEVAEKMLQDLRVKAGEVTPYNEGEFVQRGDNVIVDYEGFVDGEKVDSLCGNAEMLTVGASQLIEFDDNLLGMTIGETREFDLVVPENGLPSMVGKTIHFVVTLNMGSKTIPAALDDSLAERVGKKDFTELRAFIQGTAQSRVQEHFRNKVIEAVANRLVESNNFEVPNWMALSEAQYLAHNSKLDWNNIPDVDKEKYLELGMKNVKLSLILDKIRDVDPEAQLSDQEVFDMIKQNIAKSKVTASFDEAMKEMNRTGYLQILMSRIRDEYTLDFVTKNVRIIE